MKRWTWGVAVILLLGVLAIAVVFAVWASVGDAPWERAKVAQTAMPSPPTLEPVFSEAEVLQLAEAQHAYTRCVSATYKDGTHAWIVNCEWSTTNAAGKVIWLPTTLLLDDQSGKLR